MTENGKEAKASSAIIACAHHSFRALLSPVFGLEDGPHKKHHSSGINNKAATAEAEATTKNSMHQHQRVNSSSIRESIARTEEVWLPLILPVPPHGLFPRRGQYWGSEPQTTARKSTMSKNSFSPPQSLETRTCMIRFSIGTELTWQMYSPASASETLLIKRSKAFLSIPYLTREENYSVLRQLPML